MTAYTLFKNRDLIGIYATLDLVEQAAKKYLDNQPRETVKERYTPTTWGDGYQIHSLRIFKKQVEYALV